ncbi:nucleoside-triphosphatase [Psychroserpens ponticola]|uniref:Nucleoside-triphosphatase n=1 Tax=Psychroserpens ponticola TaxID=2932268 RepID=A0ABY7RX05_9FLAO|nr:nucleoside-triphosphatase [Psychroserpens ponticola]WCO01206.1 nucleoside-triphosphatase [Psychroserpens ponticola]
MIYILTGAIRTGKTTALLDWSNTRTNVDGLLCPDDENGKRFFLKVKSNEGFKLEVESENKVTIIGNFKFLKSAFTEANDFLLSKFSETEHKFLIIDELGKLELKNEGLHLSTEAIIPKYMQNENQHLILVVRDYLLDAILKHYTISKYKVLKKEDFKLWK